MMSKQPKECVHIYMYVSTRLLCRLISQYLPVLPLRRFRCCSMEIQSFFWEDLLGIYLQRGSSQIPAPSFENIQQESMVLFFSDLNNLGHWVSVGSQYNCHEETMGLVLCICVPRKGHFRQASLCGCSFGKNTWTLS